MYKVSVIIPTYNSEQYIIKTLESVIKQTYKNLEIIVVDDASTDNTVEKIKKLQMKENRIKLLQLNNNSGAAVSRNLAIDKSEGRFLAFLDADDLWIENKIERQIKFMLEKDIAFCFTDYELIDSLGESLKKKITMPPRINYNQLLKNTIIQTCTVMLDKEKLGKIQMPNLKRGQDFATWLLILKEIDYSYAINETLAYYRRTPGSLSSNKIKAVKRTWYIYRKVENFNFIKSLYYCTFYALNAIRKRIYYEKLLG